MKLRVLTLGAVIGFLFAVVPSCGAPKCGPANCKGCCGSDGKCVDPSTNANCGTSGTGCKACGATETCTSGACVGGAGGSGGSGGSGGGGTGCGPSSCPNGCCAGSGSTAFCMKGDSASNCGTGGILCAQCDTVGGSTCGAAKSCSDGGTPGLPPGSLGAPCNTEADCNALSPAGKPNICLKTTSPGGWPYKNGYCTRRCIPDSDCGPNGSCEYGFGDWGEALNMCMLKCTGTGSAATCPRESEGYDCVGMGSSYSVCWTKNPDGGAWDVYDAGPGAAPGVIGGPCDNSAQCQPPASGTCIPEVRADGGASGYYGGSCYADCTLAPFENYCGNGGLCIPQAIPSEYAGLPAGQDPFVSWYCTGGCRTDGGATDACRGGYACDPFSATTNQGECVPRCDVDGGAGGCATGKTCNPATGLCG